MKFGEQIEQASVPGWSLHNVDYNSLKHQIKVHTTKDQANAATAIAIPGQQDHALRRFEDAFYLELCSQHNRVGLFVTSKADEISRRLRMPFLSPISYALPSLASSLASSLSCSPVPSLVSYLVLRPLTPLMF